MMPQAPHGAQSNRDLVAVIRWRDCASIGSTAVTFDDRLVRTRVVLTHAEVGLPKPPEPELDEILVRLLRDLDAVRQDK